MFEEEKRIYAVYVDGVLGLDEPAEQLDWLREQLRNADGLLLARRAAAAESEATIIDRFSDSLVHLELLLAVAAGLGQSMLDELLPEEADGESVTRISAPRLWRVIVISQLWLRGIAIAEEVLALLKAGFTAAALARWRTLHELEVIALVIGRSADAIEHELHRYDERDLARIASDRSTFKAQFPRGSILEGDYGWARRFVIESDRHRYRESDHKRRFGPSFRDLQRSVGVTRRERDLYDAANRVVHGAWLSELLGTRDDKLAADPEKSKNRGMTLAMSGAARTLWWLTGTLTEVAVVAGARSREEEFGTGELVIASLHASLGVKEDPTAPAWQ